MTAQEKAWQAAESAAAALAPDADVFGSVDAAGLGSSTFAVLRRAAAKPTATTSATMTSSGIMSRHASTRGSSR